MPTPSGTAFSVLGGLSCSGSTCTAVGYYDNSSFVQFTLAETWNGTAWTIQTTPNPSGATTSLLAGVSCRSSSQCTAVGSYDNGAGDEMLAEAWNGHAWSIQTTPNPSGATTSLLDGVSCSSATACIAVGDSVNPSVGEVALAEAWNGHAWSARSAANPSGDLLSVLDGVSCTSPTECTAVGYYTSSSYTELTLAEQWKGGVWSIQNTEGNGGSSELYGVSCSSATDCLAVGYYTGAGESLAFSATWNGTAWNPVDVNGPTGTTTSALNGVSCGSATTCIAVGSYENGSGGDLTLAEAWSGSVRTIQSTPNAVGTSPANSVLNSVSCYSAKACTAVGYYYDSSGIEVTLAESWNGTVWSIQETPNPAAATAPGSVLDGVSCKSAKDCVAVGYYNVSSESAALLIEAWNGTKWLIDKAPVPKGASDTYLSGASCSSATDCTAVGSYFNGNNLSLIERWNGTAWAVQVAPVPVHSDGNYLVGVSCSSAKACTAVGYYFYSSGSAHAELTLSEAWSGTTWKVQPSKSPAGSTDNDESDLDGVSCLSANACTAAGYFWSNSAEAYLLFAEAWNGTTWKVQSTPKVARRAETEATTSPVDGVSCTSTKDCTIVGYYENTEGEDVTLAEGWNGTTWAIQKTSNLEASVFYGVSCYSTACSGVGSTEDNGTEVTLAEGHS